MGQGSHTPQKVVWLNRGPFLWGENPFLQWREHIGHILWSQSCRSTSPSPCFSVDSLALHDFSFQNFNREFWQSVTMARGPIGYAWFFWVIFTISMTLCVVDRFTLNVWPRQNLGQISERAKVSDSSSIRQGPWSVWFDDFFSKFSGRYTLLGLCFLYLTMMHNVHFYLSGTWINRFIDFGDYVNRIKAHKYLGFSMAVISILHVWTVLFPGIFSGYSIEVRSGFFVFPISEMRPKGFQHANVTTKVMMMQVDDVYRTVMITLVMGPIVYASVRLISSNYRIGIRLHQFVMIMYLVDIARRHTHPHCWVFNIPCFIFWVADVIWGHFYRHQSTQMQRVSISPNYMLLYWQGNISGGRMSIADVFYIRTKCCHCRWERSHPFTCISRRNVALSDLRSFVDLYSNGARTFEPTEWNRAFLVRTYDKRLSHTREMRDSEELLADVWGGFRFGRIADHMKSKDDVVLIGGGSGGTFLIDALFYLASQRIVLDKGTKSTWDDSTRKSKVWTSKSLSPPQNAAPEHQGRSLLFRNSFFGEHSDNRHFQPLSESDGSLTNEPQQGVEHSTIQNSQGSSPCVCHYSHLARAEKENQSKKAVGIIFTTSDPQLSQWFANFVEDILDKNKMPESVQLHLIIALTGGHSFHPRFSRGTVHTKRCDFADEIVNITAHSERKKPCQVFCQGGVSLQDAARSACTDTEATYHEAHSFDNSKASPTIAMAFSKLQAKIAGHSAAGHSAPAETRSPAGAREIRQNFDATQLPSLEVVSVVPE